MNVRYGRIKRELKVSTNFGLSILLIFMLCNCHPQPQVEMLALDLRYEQRHFLRGLENGS